MRTFITLTIFITIAVASFWFLQDITDKQVQDKKTTERFPDYFMDNFSITNMNQQGQPEYQLEAKKMLHYPDDDSAELTQPFIQVTQTDNNITITASRAIFLQQKNIIYLHDNVVIHRAASKNQNELSIYTDYLKINTQSHIAETNLPALIQTAEATLNSVGLIYDNKQGILKLQTQVKGTYETAN
jgi:lipopolysaccharide export system protein LptC